MAEAQACSFEATGQASVTVEIPAGVLVVASWHEPRVEVEVAPRRGDERSAAAAAETRVSATERGGRQEVVVRAPRREGKLGLGWRRGPELEVTVRCPEGSDVDFGTATADLDARGSLGAVAVRSASGDASLEDAASLSFTTASGDLSAGSIAGGLTTKGASGDVDVRSVGGPASVNTVSGDVRLGSTAGAAAVRTVSGDVDLRAAAAGIEIGSVSGDVEVAAVPGLVLWIDAQSVSGTMTSELDVGDEPAADGAQTVELRIRTVSGDVRLTRSTVTAR